MYDSCLEYFDEVFIVKEDRFPNEVHGSEDENGLDKISIDPIPISLSSKTSSIDLYHRVCPWLPSCSTINNIDKPKMIYPKPLMMVKKCPQIKIKGKLRDPLDLFDNTNPVSHPYCT